MYRSCKLTNSYKRSVCTKQAQHSAALCVAVHFSCSFSSPQPWFGGGETSCCLWAAPPLLCRLEVGNSQCSSLWGLLVHRGGCQKVAMATTLLSLATFFLRSKRDCGELEGPSSQAKLKRSQSFAGTSWNDHGDGCVAKQWWDAETRDDRIKAETPRKLFIIFSAHVGRRKWKPFIYLPSSKKKKKKHKPIMNCSGMISIHFHQQDRNVVIKTECSTFSNKRCQWISSIHVAWELHQLRKTWNLKPAWECGLLNVFCMIIAMYWIWAAEYSIAILDTGSRPRSDFHQHFGDFWYTTWRAKNCNPLLTHLHNWQTRVFHKPQKPRIRHLFPIIPSSLCPINPGWGNTHRLRVS